MSDFQDPSTHLNSEPYRGSAQTHPSSTLVFEEHSLEAKKIFFLLRSRGWDHDFPCSSVLLKSWIKWLQYITRFWSLLTIQKCFTREELFYGNLVVGPSFAEYVKKCRFYTMQYNIGLESLALQEEYILDGWAGYDSILPESNFIHWVEEIDDFPWCMIEPTFSVDRSQTSKDMNTVLGRYFPPQISLKGNTDFLKFVKPSKVFDPSLTSKSGTRLVREILFDVGKISSGWVGSRCKIQVMPAGGRDTSIATPSTLVKIKYSNEIFKQLCEANPYSAMASHRVQERRINRIRTRGKVFLHWDFKKLGLVCQRSWFMALASCIQDKYNIDMSWFDFDDLTIKDGKRSYNTKRGFALGWMNEGVTLVIIHWLTVFFQSCSENWKEKFDFVVFNDDVEIALRFEPSVEDMDVLKNLMLDYFKSIDVPCSIKKIFFSKQSIFLEDYFDPIEEFDFKKNSIAIRLYAKAAMNTLPVAVKGYMAAASQIYKEPYIIKEILSKTATEFDEDEYDWHHAAGGYFISYRDGLNTITEDLTAMSLSMALSEVRPMEINKKFSTDFSWQKAQSSQDRIMERASNRHDFVLPNDQYADSFLTGLTSNYFSTAASLLMDGSPIQEMSDRRAHVRLVHDPGGALL